MLGPSPYLGSGWSIETSNSACRFIGRVLTNESKIRSKAIGKELRDMLLGFGTPCISRKRLELEMSSLSGRLTTGRSNKSIVKLGQKSQEWSRDLLFKFWDPAYLGNGWR